MSMADLYYQGQAPAATNPQQQAAADRIIKAFKDATGRDLTPEEALRDHLSGGRYIGENNITSAVNAINNSEEAKAFKAKAATATTDTPGSATTPPTSSAYAPRKTEGGALTYTPRDYQGAIGRSQGFEPSRIGNQDDTYLKYVFLRSTAGLDPRNYQQSIPEVVRRLNEQGIQAKAVGEDSIDFGNGEGPVDILSGDGETQQWWWGLDGAPAASSSSSMADLIKPPSTQATAAPDTTVAAPPQQQAPAPTTMSAASTAATPPPSAPAAGGEVATPPHVEQAAQLFADSGVKILEIRGDQMRILTAEDQADGNQYGSWVSVNVAPAGQGSPASMADYLRG